MEPRGFYNKTYPYRVPSRIARVPDSAIGPYPAICLVRDLCAWPRPLACFTFLYPTVSRCRVASEKGRMQIAAQLRGVKRQPGAFSISTAQWDFIASRTQVSIARPPVRWRISILIFLSPSNIVTVIKKRAFGSVESRLFKRYDLCTFLDLSCSANSSTLHHVCCVIFHIPKRFLFRNFLYILQNSLCIKKIIMLDVSRRFFDR